MQTDSERIAETLEVEVRFDRAIYRSGDAVVVTLTLMTPVVLVERPSLLLFAASSHDYRVVSLRPTSSPVVYVSETSVRVIGSDDADGPADDLAMAAGELLFALFSLSANSAGTAATRTEVPPGGSELAAAFAVIADDKFEGSPVRLLAALSVADREGARRAGGKRVGMLAAGDALPVEIPVDEVIFYPRDEVQLQQFLSETGAVVLANGQPACCQGGPAQEGRAGSYLLRLPEVAGDATHLPQLRSLHGEESSLYASSDAVLRLYASVMEYRVRGFVVGVNPRLQLMDAPSTVDGPADLQATRSADVFSDDRSVCPNIFADPIFGVRKAWAFGLVHPRSVLPAVPIAFLDQGFAPNFDYPGYGAGLFERDVTSANAPTGPHVAEAPPTVGDSFFGAPEWHGNGVVTTAVGVVNNGWGAAGTGGLVATRPMLYRFGLSEYAFEVGQGIRLAVDDGATIINFSAGYPCKVLTNIGVEFRVCSPGERAAFCGAITAELESAVVAAFAIPFVGPILGPIAQEAVNVALTACFATILLGDPRGPMESAIDYATEHGVTVISIAGNAQSRDSLGELCDFIPCGPQDVTEWEVVPGVIPDVICCGAASDTPHYENQEYFGDRVDIWAPIGSWYFHPPTLDAVTGPDQQNLKTGFAGTSAAAPFVSGVVAMMQAINPDFDPRGQHSPAERRAIPGRIRDVLKSTASTSATNPALTPDVRRRNLIDAYAAVRAAAFTVPQGGNTGFQLDYDALGYDTSLGLDDHIPNAGNTQGNPKIVSSTYNGSVTGTILAIPRGEGPGGVPHYDDDWYAYTTPATSGVYSGGKVTLIMPEYRRAWIDNQLGRAVPAPSAHEVAFEYDMPALFEQTVYLLQVTSFGTNSGPYKLQLSPAQHSAEPTGDRFDVRTGLIMFRHNNDTWERAVPLGTAQFPWSDSLAGTAFAGLSYALDFPDLNFDRHKDEDWFQINPPQGWETSFDADCPPWITVSTGPGVTINVFGSSHNLFRTTTLGHLAISYHDFVHQLPLRIQLLSTIGGPVTYELHIEFDFVAPGICRLEQELHQRLIKRLYGTGIIRPGDSGPGDFGRQAAPEEFHLIDWRGSGHFEVHAYVSNGEQLHLALCDLDQHQLTDAVTPMLGATHPSAGLARPFGAVHRLELSVDSLPSGVYMLHITEASTKSVFVVLPRDAVHDGSVPLEATVVAARG